MLSQVERSVVEELAERRDEIVRLASDLIRFDTTARNVGDPPREERGLQELLAARLAQVGAEIDLFEPDAEELAGRPLVPPGLDFVGRPQLIARLHGHGAGRSLIFNGHIDVVPASIEDGWASDPFTPEVRGGLLYGRGACDMKGGIAAMMIAAETLARRKLLAGDLVIATNTDEESSGAGGTALVHRGLRADGAIVTEPTGGDVWVSCRGSSYGEIIVPGRPGHAEIAHAPWRDGGAVNAIEKTALVIEALQALRAKWGNDPLLTHERLSPPDVLPTVVRAGEWAVTIPGEACVTIAACFLPQQAGADGFGGPVEREIESWLQEYCARDDWLVSNPPTVDWWPNRVMPMEIPTDAAVVSTASGAASDLGIATRLGGLDSWYDGATLTLLAGTPAVGFGPDGFGEGNANVAHAVDEFVPVDGLLRCAQALAVAALRFCNT